MVCTTLVIWKQGDSNFSKLHWQSQHNKGFSEGHLPYSKRTDDAELFQNTILLEIYAQLQKFSLLILACK
jgi:hypothetical protein